MYTKDIITKYLKIKAKKILYTSNMGAKNTNTNQICNVVRYLSVKKMYMYKNIYTSLH